MTWRASPFNDPTEFAQTLAVSGAAPCDPRMDVALAQWLARQTGIVTTIGMDGFRFLTWLAEHGAKENAIGADRGRSAGEAIPRNEPGRGGG